ncbi:putative isoamyl alcohol oxidase [Aspergillus campestris IBT 28561]|uniref:Isoamyl alcohol oxidase n=1 Tax=Aspergillus campestris (strain IBT 28561) TaxID=1392248 RepID=A0A2I1D0P8_ASPC2|nr:putative isoamyl alcohol oxidase [Aspergillus campestris IBT 28561]PKY03432.1 putative isoamyl alcohol oxidase [Aspergillus campestris IBT 28561]
MLVPTIATALILQAVSAASAQTVIGSEPPVAVHTTRHCKYIPGDVGWPQPQLWSQLNQTVEGRLIATVPVGSVCHDPTYDEAKCLAVTANWAQPQLSLPLPAEFMLPYFLNDDCTPFTPRATRCELGNYAAYSIEVRSIDDVRAGIRFARTHNIRLVINNSGHDFYGQSTGKGALSLWMHHYNETTFIRHYSSAYYSGPALRVQTGAEGGAAGAHASGEGYTVVAGACPTVKMAGGYLGGGGHGYLAGRYGFAADQVLEWELVTADGAHVVATPTQKPDLYWALSGGSPGSFGVVLSATVRAFPNEITANAAFSFGVREAGGVESYWKAVHTFHHQLKPLLDQGIVAEYVLANETLAVTGVLAPGHTRASLLLSLQPLMAALAESSGGRLTARSLRMRVTQAQSYHDLFAAEIAPLLAELALPPAVAGRFVPRQLMDGDTTALDSTLRAIADRGYSYTVIALNVINAMRNDTAPPIAPNAVQPTFHAAYSSLMINAGESGGLDVQQELVEEILPLYDAVAPEAGSYKNEGHWAERDVKTTFYGGMYERLEAIKNVVDPNGVFYGVTSVGFDRFEWDERGRLCRVI